MLGIIVLSVLCVFVPVSAQITTTVEWTHLGSILNFWDRPFHPTFRDDLWGFDSMCEVINKKGFLADLVHRRPTAGLVCAGLKYKDECCDKFLPTSSSTTTTTSTTTSTTTTKPSTTTTKPSTTTSTENPLSQLCEPVDPLKCRPEPGCSPSSSRHSNRTTFRGNRCMSQCWKHCRNPCACKTAADGKCEYHSSTGNCLERRDCGNLDLECQRKQSFYSYGGVLCRSKEGQEDCRKISKRLVAVNVAGESTIDRFGIVYERESKSIIEDTSNTKVNRNEIEKFQGPDKFLYGTVASGQPNGEAKRQCLYYPMRVVENGLFELSVRTMEPDYELTGKRLFSLTLNGLPIVSHVDIRAISNGLKPSPVDIIVIFKIEEIANEPRRRLILAGHRPINTTNLITLGICIAECRLCEEYKRIDPGYILSGFSLIHFDKKEDK